MSKTNLQALQSPTRNRNGKGQPVHEGVSPHPAAKGHQPHLAEGQQKARLIRAAGGIKKAEHRDREDRETLRNAFGYARLGAAAPESLVSRF